MLSQSLILLALSRAAFATPQPQDVEGRPRTTLPSTLESLPEGVHVNTNIVDPPPFFSDLPTLPLSIYEILATAVPHVYETRTEYPCDLATEAWFSKIPNDVKTALVSYKSAAISWAIAHSSDLGDSFPTAIVQCIATTDSKDHASSTGSETAEVTGFVTTVGGAVETGSASISGTRSASMSGSGTVTGGSLSGNGAVATGSVTSMVSPGAAPRATGAVAGSLAGIVGAFGVIAML